MHFSPTVISAQSHFQLDAWGRFHTEWLTVLIQFAVIRGVAEMKDELQALAGLVQAAPAEPDRVRVYLEVSGS